MKTRTLMLLALACGVAIMAAGAAFLIQLSSQDEAEQPTPIGDEVIVGDMRVIVGGSEEREGVLAVALTIGGVDDPDGTAGFMLIASGRAARPGAASVDDGTAESDCGVITVEPRNCVVRFDVSGADGESRVLFYERGDERARGVLA
jgi:hypothetical protein